MFQFQSFHMYGIIGSALAIGTLIVQLIKHYHIKSFFGEHIDFPPKEKTIKKYIIGGII